MTCRKRSANPTHTNAIAASFFISNGFARLPGDIDAKAGIVLDANRWATWRLAPKCTGKPATFVGPAMKRAAVRSAHPGSGVPFRWETTPPGKALSAFGVRAALRIS